MDKYEQLEQRIIGLENQLKELQNFNTIPYTIDKSFLGRGFLKAKAPAIFVIGADQGAWLNQGGGLVAFPTAFAIIAEGEFNGFWIPLYQPPNQVTPGH